MDKKIEKKFWSVKRVAMIAGGTALISLIGYVAFFKDKRSQLRVEQEKITISEVTNGDFTEFISVTGTLVPVKSVFLDALEGGSVEKMMKQSGDFVQAGEVIMQLSNNTLKLDVMNREAQLFDQLNNVRNSRLSLDQNSMSLKNQLAEAEYQIKILEQQARRNDATAKFISDKEIKDLKEQLAYNRKRLGITYKGYAMDSSLRIQQNQQMSQSEKRIWENLQGVKQILDYLTVKAPISGQLSMQDWQIGQSINRSQRIGQIDVLDNFKVRVQIDELYLPRIVKGLKGYVEVDNGEFEMIIDKIYPTVAGGRFEVDMIFSKNVPKDVRRGQTMRIRLELGKSEKAMLLPVGGFYQNTGGNWVFVVEPDGKRAIKRPISLGLKNPNYYVVTEGLKIGEKVITSSYEFFGDNEVLMLSEEEKK
jgi:HlyD family secretion protein